MAARGEPGAGTRDGIEPPTRGLSVRRPYPSPKREIGNELNRCEKEAPAGIEPANSGFAGT